MANSECDETRTTAILATLFFLTSLGLSYLFSQTTAPTSVVDRVQPAQSVPAPSSTPAAPPAGLLPSVPESAPANAAQEPAPAPAEAPPPAAAQVAEVRPSGLFLDNFDKGVRPQDDLYRYVNGSWLAKTEIPADRSNYGSFVKLQDEVERNLHVVADEAASARSWPAGSRQQWLGDFYASYMDEARANALGAAPLAGPLAGIGAIKDRRQLVEYFLGEI